MFAADLSWTDTNDQVNREKRENERRQSLSTSSEISFSRPKVPKNKDDVSSFTRTFFRRKPKHDGDKSSSSSSSTSSRSPTSLELQDPFAKSLEAGVRSFANLELEDEILSIEYVHSNPSNGFAPQKQPNPAEVTEITKERPQKREHLRPPPLKAASRGPLRSIKLSDPNNIEDRPKLTQQGDDFAVMKSVTIAVQYSALDDEPTPPTSPYLIDGTNFSTRAWKANDGENSICLGLFDKSAISLVGTKCTAPGTQKSNYEHAPRCFENLVKIMETSSPRVILEQLHLLRNASSSTETNLEYQLWISTLLEGRALKQYRGGSQTRDNLSFIGRPEILDLNGSIGDLYRIANNNPISRILHLTSMNAAKDQSTLPTSVTQNITDLAAAAHGSSSSFILPYVNGSMDKIYISRPASLLPSAKIPGLLVDCFRVLKPGGVLTVRLMDALPDRSSAGPRLTEWLDENLLEVLEQEFRCSKPSSLLPRWIKAAGFSISTGSEESIRLPLALKPDGGVLAALGMEVTRALWKQTWSTYVEGTSAGKKCWWDNQDIIQECNELETKWSIVTVTATKPK